MMFTKQRYRGSRLLSMTGCALAVLCAGLAAPATAQDASQQLPQGFAEEQVPPSFAGAEDAGQSANILTQPSSQTATPAENVPEQPEQRRLVPATAMGRGAVESAQQDVDTAPMPPQQMMDPLEQYTAQAGRNQAAIGGEDALPSVAMPSQTMLDTNVDATLQGGLSEVDEQALQEEIRTEAFDAAITGMFPLSPDQIRQTVKKYDETQKAALTPAYDAPKPQVSVQNISLDPGVLPPVIKTAVGNVTTLNILDATGAPWPVQDVTWAGDYEIVEPEEGGHIIRITPMSHFARGNIVIRLLTLKTPLTLTLETGRDVVQYRVDARVPEYGPFANAPLMQGSKSSMVAGSSELTSILDGVAPGGATKLEVAGVDGRTTAYTMGGTTYVRTPLTLLSPAWQSSVSSADGMNVYALSHAPVLLLSDGGEFTRAVLKEKEDLLDE